MPSGGDTALNGDSMASGHRSEPDEDAPPAEEDEQEEDEDDRDRDEERRPGESDSDTIDWGAGGGDESWPWPSATMSTDQSHQASPRASPTPLAHALAASPRASPTGDAGEHPTPDTGRRNKRKNFQPRAIVYQYAEAAAETSGAAPDDTRDSFSEPDEQALDLTEARAPPRPSASEPTPMDLTVRTPTQINSALQARPPAAVDPSEMKRYAENTMRELLGIYGFPSDPSEAHQSPAGEFCGDLSLVRGIGSNDVRDNRRLLFAFSVFAAWSPRTFLLASAFVSGFHRLIRRLSRQSPRLFSFHSSSPFRSLACD